MSILDMAGGAAEGLQDYLLQMLREDQLEEEKKRGVEGKRHNEATEKLSERTIAENAEYRKTQQESNRLVAQRQAEQQRNLEANRSRDDIRAGLDDLMPGVTITPQTRDSAVRAGAALPERFKGVIPYDDDFMGPINETGPQRGEIGSYELQGSPKANTETSLQRDTYLIGGKPEDVFINPKTREMHLVRTGELVPEGAAQHYEKPPAPDRVLIQTGDGFMRRPDAAKTLADGGDVPLPDTAATRDRKERVGGMVPFLKRMRQYSDEIITKVGPEQRLDAIKRGAETVFGQDPDFKVFQDFRNSLSVMLSVAQQGSRPSDADVFRAALPMVPNPYADTKESAARKWDMIFSMFSRDLSPEMKAELGITDESGAGQTGGVPVVGGMFNGGKVLKVTPIQQ